MEQFKLIAIEPLKGCAQHIIKDLEVDKKYYFYQGYRINEQGSVEEDKTITLQPNFFSKEEEPNISIHAIVGRNGSGKSAIIELLMRVINNLSFIHNRSELGTNGLVPIFGITANLYFLKDNIFYKIYLSEIEKKNKTIVKATIRELNDKAKEIDIDPNIFKKQIQPFFYTIINNYSLYAYNIRDFDEEKIDWTHRSGEIDIPDRDWINGICHKNDGYSTPIVVNPMRIDGNIDINTETHLTRSRLLSMLVNHSDETTSLWSFNTGDDVKRTIIKINIYSPLKNDASSNQNESTDNNLIFDSKYKLGKLFPKVIDVKTAKKIPIYKKIVCVILSEWGRQYYINEIKNPISFDKINNTIEYNYIVAKTMDIINKYSRIICSQTEYNLYDFSKNGLFGLNIINEDSIKKIVKEHVCAIIEDNSHISLKIKQALNYVRFTREIYRDKIANNNKSLTVGEFSKMIKNMASKYNNKNSNILYFMPPSFLKFELYYTDDKSDNEYPFKYLSSGEKQLTYFITTILYHLRNLDSAFDSNVDRAKYDYVNIILEEIELYFHPEMQRIMVDSLIKNIQGMHLKHLKAINICLVTHSPIILSDIPKQNILFLEHGKPIDINDNTFGANIYSLYKHSFFMDIPMGEFARNKIDCMFDNLRKNKIVEDEQETTINEIQMVGEPLLKNQLLNLYYDKCKKHIIKERVLQLEKEVEKLKKQLTHDKD